jgi:hypothetical protein
MSILNIKNPATGEWEELPYIIGPPGVKGDRGADGTSVTVKSISESTTDGGSNIVTFSDGSILTIKNGSKGSPGDGSNVDLTGYATEEYVNTAISGLGDLGTRLTAEVVGKEFVIKFTNK